MVLSRRLLTAARGFGSFGPPLGPPPTDDSWTRYVSNPILTATEVWEGNWILEPSVLHESGIFKMIYCGDNDVTSQQVGLATSSDGFTWTKYVGNPVFGGGVGGEAGNVTQPALFKVGSTYRLYYRSPTNYLCIATSSDLINWSVFDTNIISNPDGQSEWDNTSIVIDGGGTWHMLAEGFKSPIYKTYYWSSSDGLAWTAGNSGNPLTTLQVASGGMWGGPFIWPVMVGGSWHLWYHAAPSAGLLPTNIYHATSPDFVTWTQTLPSPVLTYTGGGSYEHDQVADPSLVVVGETAFLFFDGDNNDVPMTGAIGVATAPAV
jgi:sucrose-6-phosphate hydrolase SacC (GH32 family)